MIPTSKLQKTLRGPGCLAVFLATLALAGCGTQGDFGEVKPSLVKDGIHDWMSGAAVSGEPSSFELTDDERQLRDLGYPLIEPPYDRQKWYSVLNEYGASADAYRAGIPRTAYSDELQSSRYRSTTSRYAKLIDDARNDVTRIPGFFEVAARVLDLDRKRQKSMAFVSGLSEAERGNALRRIKENIAIARWVHTALRQRHDAYRYALSRLVIMAPSPQAVDVELTLDQLRNDIERYRIGPAPGDRVAYKD